MVGSTQQSTTVHLDVVEPAYITYTVDQEPASTTAVNQEITLVFTLYFFLRLTVL